MYGTFSLCCERVSSRGSVTRHAGIKNFEMRRCPFLKHAPMLEDHLQVVSEFRTNRYRRRRWWSNRKRKIEKWRVCPRCSDPEEGIVILEHFKCPGEFEITKPKASTNMRIYIVNAYNEHPYLVIFAQHPIIDQSQVWISQKYDDQRSNWRSSPLWPKLWFQATSMDILQD